MSSNYTKLPGHYALHNEAGLYDVIAVLTEGEAHDVKYSHLVNAFEPLGKAEAIETYPVWARIELKSNGREYYVQVEWWSMTPEDLASGINAKYGKE